MNRLINIQSIPGIYTIVNCSKLNVRSGIGINTDIIGSLYPGNQVIIYEKKFQQTNGSADEKPQTCAFKIYEYKKLFSSLGVKNVYYIYIFNDWFKKSEYKDMLDYINSVDGCSYTFL